MLLFKVRAARFLGLREEFGPYQDEVAHSSVQQSPALLTASKRAAKAQSDIFESKIEFPGCFVCVELHEPCDYHVNLALIICLACFSYSGHRSSPTESLPFS